MEDRQRIFKIASILLQYPEQEWIDDADLLWEVSHLEIADVRELYGKLLDYLKNTEVEQLAEQYVTTFDFSDKTTLYLTYAIFGDGKERGPAFVKLNEEFDSAGYQMTDEELPDFLPAVLEFASLVPEESARKVFLIHKKAIDQLAAELEAMESPYRWVMQGCVQVMNDLIEERKAS